MAIFLLRHCETYWNVQGRKQGHGNSSLTPRGHGQARALGRFLARNHGSLAGFEITSSPLGRAMDTTRIICEETGFPVEETQTDPLLIEADHGDFEGHTLGEIARKFPGAIEARRKNHWNYRFPNGESYADVSTRAGRWLHAQCATRHLVAVTHEMLSRCIRGQYLGLSPGQCLALSHPQDRIFVLSEGRVREHCVDDGPMDER